MKFKFKNVFLFLHQDKCLKIDEKKMIDKLKNKLHDKSFEEMIEMAKDKEGKPKFKFHKYGNKKPYKKGEHKYFDLTTLSKEIDTVDIGDLPTLPYILEVDDCQRVVGYFNNNKTVFVILFFDPFHQIYPFKSMGSLGEKCISQILEFYKLHPFPSEAQIENHK
ncbi:hypothetical protein [Candidatus Phytoplasma pruni]|uniref:Uncharacterized protein n=1 Tax=Candidatus Phytoplasma pruni TaxID=479893 RepID=A0A851HA20_9MOLU|nr:hypothetical protein [Candidatus Phytoplasma pruni]NWN45792.1 hypothetical protein [Candidatus Phytoplasma pruni]